MASGKDNAGNAKNTAVTVSQWAGVTSTLGKLARGVSILSLGAYLLYSLFDRKKENEEKNRTYSWDRIKVDANPDACVPIVYGRHKVGGRVIGYKTDVRKVRPWSFIRTATTITSAATYCEFHSEIGSGGVQFQIQPRVYLGGTTNGYPFFTYFSYRIWHKESVGGTYAEIGRVGNTGDVAYIQTFDKYQGVTWIKQLGNFEYTVNDLDPTIENYIKVEKVETKTDTNTDNNFIRETFYYKKDARAWTTASHLECLLALSEGEIQDIEQVFVDDKPITHFPNAKYNKFMGANTQDWAHEFLQLSNEYSQDHEVTVASPFEYDTIGTDLDAFQIEFEVPDGLYQEDANGNESPWAISYTVEYKVYGAVSYTTVATQTVPVDGKTKNAIIFAVDSGALTANSRYSIKVTRTSADEDTTHFGTLKVTSVEEISYDTLMYPNTALLSVGLDATDEISGGFPDITSIIRGRKVSCPDVYNGASLVYYDDYYWDPDASEFKLWDGTSLTWDGATYSEKYSANPAWCMKDFIENTRYGIAKYLNGITVNMTTWLSLAKHYDERVESILNAGTYEKRFRLDVAIYDISEALDMLNEVCASFRSITYLSGETINMICDRLTTPTHLFGMGNIIRGTFHEEWLPKSDIPNVVEVVFNNENKDWEKDTVVVQDDDSLALGIRREQRISMTATRPTQAIREARHVINIANEVKRVMTFKTGWDALNAQPGDVVNFAHDTPGWGLSGRVVTGSTKSIVKLDNSVTLQAVANSITVRFAANGLMETRVISDAAGIYSQVGVTVPFTYTPTAYDVFACGPTATHIKPFRVKSVQRNSGDGTVGFEVIEYVAAVYDDTGVEIPIQNYSSLLNGIPDVYSVKISEHIRSMGDNATENVIDVYFTPPVDADYYLKSYSRSKIYISTDAGSTWEFKGETSGSYFAVAGGITEESTYRIAVVSVDENGIENNVNDSPYDDIYIVGRSERPNAITSFTGAAINGKLVLRWDQASDIDVRLGGWVEIRHTPDNTNPGWTAGMLLGRVAGNQTTAVVPLRSGYYYAKAMDSYGLYSTLEASFVMPFHEVIGYNVIDTVTENPAYAGLASSSGVTVDPGTENLIIGEDVQDAGFESGAFGDWVSPLSAQANISSADKRTGTYSLLFTAVYAGIDYSWPITLNSYQVIALPAATDFIFSAYIKGDARLDGAAGDMVMRVRNAASVVVAELNIADAAYADWTKKNLEFTTVAAENYTIGLEVIDTSSGLSANSYMYMDDVKLFKVAAQTGTYVFSNAIDLGAVHISRLVSDVIIGAYSIDDIWDSRTGNFDDAEGSFDGDAESAYARLYVRYTEDDPAGSPTWSGWQELLVGEYKARAFEFKVELITDDPTQNVNVSKLVVVCDMVDRIESGSVTTNAAPGGEKAVTFAASGHNFYAIPQVMAMSGDLQDGDTVLISSVTTDGFDISVYNGAARVARTIGWTAKGYGYEVT